MPDPTLLRPVHAHAEERACERCGAPFATALVYEERRFELAPDHARFCSDRCKVLEWRDAKGHKVPGPSVLRRDPR